MDLDRNDCDFLQPAELPRAVEHGILEFEARLACSREDATDFFPTDL